MRVASIKRHRRIGSERWLRRVGIIAGVSTLLLSALGLTALPASAAPACCSLTSTSLSASTDTSVSGQVVTFTATVSGSDGGTPTGQVQAYISVYSCNFFGCGYSWTPYGQPFDLSGGTGVGYFQFYPSSEPGFDPNQLHQSFYVYYLGDSTYTSSASGSVVQNLSQASTTISVGGTPNPAAYGQTVTFTVSVFAVYPGGGVVSGDVTLYNFGSPIDSGTLVNGVATLHEAGSIDVGLGHNSITAAYPGNYDYSSSGSNAYDEVVNQGATSTTLSSSANPATQGQSVTFNALVTGPPQDAYVPSGTVLFKDGSATLGTSAVDAGGHAKLSTSTLALGTHSITAAYSGDSGFTPSTSLTVTQSIRRATSASLISSANPSTFGQGVSFTATVRPVPNGGTVQFSIDGKAFGPAVTVNTTTGAATSTTTAALRSGSHTIGAVYGGAPNFAGSRAPTLTQRVGVTTTITLASSANPSAFGQGVSFTATVSPVPNGGNAQFYIDGKAFGPPVAVNTTTGAVKSGTSTSLTPGSHTIAAVYLGYGNFAGSTATLTQIVHRVATATTLGSSVNPSTVGKSVSFTATVRPVPNGGTVQFYIDGTTFGSPVAVNTTTGVATSGATSSLTTGSHTIGAVYLGYGNFAGSTATTLTQKVQVATATSLISSANPSTVGQAVSFTAKVNPVPNGGTVQFYIDGTAFGSPVTVNITTGAATSGPTTSLTAGSHLISAVYSGFGNFARSTSPTLTQTVQ